jgi:hypothetical protein
MPSDRNFTNLTINRERAEKYRESFETYGIDQTFNKWILDLIESGLKRMEYIKKHFPNYAFAGLEGEGFAFIDKSKDEIFRIRYEGSELTCSKHGKELCDHKLFATFHPKFTGGKQ